MFISKPQYSNFLPDLINNQDENLVHVSQCIVPKKPGLQSQEQMEYETKCWKTCIDLDALIDASGSFDEFLEATGKYRQEIALSTYKGTTAANPFNDDLGYLFFDLGTSDLKKFGELRTNHRFETPLAFDYQDMCEAVKELKEDEPMMEWDFYSHDDDYPVKLGFRTGRDIKGEIILLSKYSYNGLGKSTLIHTSPENLPAVRQQCRYLYDEILRLDANKFAKETHDLLAELHWWLSQATFFKRGSAACSEIMIGTLTIRKFGKLNPYKESVFPDKLALVTSCEKFVAMYPSLRVS